MLTDSQIARLLDIANAGCHKGMVLEARTIYDGVLALRPGHVPALIGQALSHVVIGEYDKAETLLRNGVLADHPDHPDARAMLGLCLSLADQQDYARDIHQPLPADNSSASDLDRPILAPIDPT